MKIFNLPKRLVLIAFMAACSLTGFGQQEPMFTQYVFNMQTVNPAYAGTWQTIGFTALARLQWVGIEGNPTTQTFSMQTPFRSENVGIGLNIVNDEIGLEQRLLFNIDYSYRLQISRESSLRLGIKAGFTNYSNPLGFYTTYPGEVSDPNFQGYVDNQFMPNVGIGAFLSSDKYYLGLSIPKLVETTFKTTEDEYTTLQEMRQYFLIGGVVFDMGRYVKFKPTVFSRAVVGAPIQYDVSANFLFNEKFWLGAMYRSGDALGVIAQWIIKDRFRIGYAYDFTITDLSNYQSGTHEIMVSYEIDWKRYVSPRYF